jgi:hypothetical protein
MDQVAKNKDDMIFLLRQEIQDGKKKLVHFKHKALKMAEE